MLRKLLLGLTLATLTLAPALAGYTGGGTFVAKTQFGTLVDNGGVVCQGTNGDGVGGGCLKFPASDGRDGTDDGRAGGFVRVQDSDAGLAVAFQVCIDNNGDGICGGPQSAADSTCPDQIFFSHADGGRFFNALGPLPTSFLRGCESNGGFPGYVVLLCEGVHDDREAGAHQHHLTQGSITLAAEGSGYGDFCGGGFGGGSTIGFVNAAAKAYTVV